MQRNCVYREYGRVPARRTSAWVAKMKVSIVIPCYEENETIEKIVEAVCNAPLKSREMSVVDHYSEDETDAVLQERGTQMVDRVIYHPGSRGEGGDLHSELAAATGDII